tara:strand:+ start:22037 stop:22870 length:834 start_codon:yes stop_codon:yes gene_type:complete
MHIGVIAGNGRFPSLVLEAAGRMGHKVTVIAIRDEADPDIQELIQNYSEASLHWVSLGQLGRCIKIFKSNDVSKALMAGQVKHTKLFSGVVPDLTFLSILKRIKTKNTDAVIAAVAEVLAENGIELIDSTAFLQPLLAGNGCLTDRGPSDDEKADLEFGYRMADAIAGLDIGQTVAVKNRAVVAVEAMEGTDEVIRRASALAGPKVVVVKVSKPNQDMRFDVPVIGLPTVRALRDADAAVLSIDAKKTLVLDGQAVFDFADECGLTIMGRDLLLRKI